MLMWSLTIRDVGMVGTECGRKALAWFYSDIIMLYYNYKQKRFGLNHRAKNISISSTGHSTVYRTDRIHSFDGNTDTECYSQKATNLSTLQLEDDDVRHLTVM